MTYCMTNLIPAGTLEQIAEVDAAIDFPRTRPEGLLSRHVGMADESVVVMTTWATKAHADRFGAEVLLPAVRSLHGTSDGATLIAFEAADSLA